MLARLFSVLVAALACQLALAAPLPVAEIAPGVFLHTGAHEEFGEDYHGDIANIGFVIGNDAIAVIDTGGSFRIGQALREAVRQRSSLPIRYVVNTHVHSDHIFGNAAFEQDQPEFIGHARLAGAMRIRAERYESNLKKMLGADADGSRIVLPTREVASELALDLGGRRLLLRAWPIAHTDHDLTVLDELSGTLWMGDLLFVDRAPSLEGDARGWIALVESLKAIPTTRAVPGHGPLVDDKAAALDKLRRYFEVLIADLRRGIAAGRPMQEVVRDAAGSERAQWLLFDTVNLRNAETLYMQLEWE